MRILIVAATDTELVLLLKSKIKLQASSFQILVTGIGMVSTAFALGKELALNKYDLAINAGIAGSYNRNIRIGEVVNVVSDTIYEMGAEDGNNFIPFHKLDVEKLSEINTGEGIIINNSPINNEAVRKLRMVKAISVNTINGNEEKIKKIIADFNPDIETMEGVAFMYACSKVKLPYLQIRSISNYVEKRNTNNWKINLAIDNLNKTILEIINSYKLINEQVNL
jgi:futalosine hydrolase